MKSLVTKEKPSLFFLSILFSLTLSSSISQQISTVAEIYNYDIGDIFHVREFGASGWYGFEEQFSYEIMDKYYSTGNDTVFYTRFVKTALSSSFEPDWVFDEYQDTVSFTNLDSLINNGVIDTVFSDMDMYNGRIVNYHHYESEYYYGSDTYIEGCGGSYLSTYDVEQAIDHILELKYFKKGDEEWGQQLMVTTGPSMSINNNLLVYPNPFHSVFYVNLTDLIFKDTEGIIYSLAGSQILRFYLRANQINRIECPELVKGIYLIKINNSSNHNQLIIKN